MLDSIVLTLDRGYFEVLLPERFNPSAKGLLKPPCHSLGLRGNFTLIKQQIAAGFRLTLRIEFSAPKLVFANNLGISRGFSLS